MNPRTFVFLAAITIATSSSMQGSFSFGTTAVGTLAYNQFNTTAASSNGFNDQLPAWIWSTGGFEFTPPEDVLLDSVTLPLRAFSNTPFTLDLYSGVGQPSTLLESVQQTIAASGGYSLYTFNFSGTTEFLQGHNYFLIGSAPQSTTDSYQVDWAASSPDAAVPWFYGETWLTGTYAPNGFLGWNTYTPTPGPAWQINADQAAAPEPGSFLLSAAGIAALAVITVRRRRSLRL